MRDVESRDRDIVRTGLFIKMRSVALSGFRRLDLPKLLMQFREELSLPTVFVGAQSMPYATRLFCQDSSNQQQIHQLQGRLTQLNRFEVYSNPSKTE